MRKIRVGIIGAGWFAAQSHIPTLAQHADVVLDSVCRMDLDELRRVWHEFGFAFGTEDYRELLARDLEAVVVSSPNHLHFEHAKAALERGLHVLCEKPMTVSPADAWELVAGDLLAAARSGDVADATRALKIALVLEGILERQQ